MKTKKNILELIIGSVGFQGLTSFPIPWDENNIDIITDFQLLEVPANSENKQLFLTEEATKKRFIILNLHEKSLESSFLTSNRASESKSKLKIEQNAYSQIRELLSSEKRPDHWDDLFGDEKKFNCERNSVGWEILWNPVDGKLWNPLLENEEKNKFFEANRRTCAEIAKDIYQERVNKLSKTFDLYFCFRGLQICPYNDGKERLKIKILCDIITPPQVIKEFIYSWDCRWEFDNSVVSEIVIEFDNENDKDITFLQKVEELLKRSNKGDKLVFRNIPLSYDKTCFPPNLNFYSFDSGDYYAWQSRTKVNTQFTWRKNPNSCYDELLFDEKMVKSLKIETTGWEKQLKFEKVSEEEYKSNVQKPFLEQNSNDNYKKLFYLFSATAILLLGIFVFRWIKKRRNYKNI